MDFRKSRIPQTDIESQIPTLELLPFGPPPALEPAQPARPTLSPEAQEYFENLNRRAVSPPASANTFSMQHYNQGGDTYLDRLYAHALGETSRPQGTQSDQTGEAQSRAGDRTGREFPRRRALVVGGLVVGLAASGFVLRHKDSITPQHNEAAAAATLTASTVSGAEVPCIEAGSATFNGTGTVALKVDFIAIKTKKSVTATGQTNVFAANKVDVAVCGIKNGVAGGIKDLVTKKGDAFNINRNALAMTATGKVVWPDCPPTATKTSELQFCVPVEDATLSIGKTPLKPQDIGKVYTLTEAEKKQANDLKSTAYVKVQDAGIKNLENVSKCPDLQTAIDKKVVDYLVAVMRKRGVKGFSSDHLDFIGQYAPMSPAYEAKASNFMKNDIAQVTSFESTCTVAAPIVKDGEK